MQELLIRSSGKKLREEGKTLLRRLSELPPFFRTLFVFSSALFLLVSFMLVVRFSNSFLVEIPENGGLLREGVIGRPRFINPVIAKSDVDRDMVALIYSGLMKATPEGGLVPDLASTYTISPDGLTYRFTLRENMVWHDGIPVTAEDVAFTIEKVRDPNLAIKSPKRASWEGVEVAVENSQNIVFTLKQPYAPFLENTTLGILPKHIWKNIPNEEWDVTYYNIEPIGSGPFRIKQIIKDSGKGLPSSYELVAFQKYALGEPYISEFSIYFFGNNKELSESFVNRQIDQMHTIEPKQVAAFKDIGATIIRDPLPRTYAAFFNQNQQPIFVDKIVRKALGNVINKDSIVKDVLLGYGKPALGPLPEIVNEAISPSVATVGGSEADAKVMLEKAGWIENAAGIYEKTDKKKKIVTLLEFSISVPDVEELKAAAEKIAETWRRIGASVTVKVFDSSTFSTEVLSPRKYDVLFYGQITGRTPDPYAYWHSSQRNSPGGNVALYTNKDVDKLLEQIRKEHDATKRTELLKQFAQEIDDDTPAVFVYSPDFLYAVSPSVRGMKQGLITTEQERFLDVQDWYINSEQVWNWFKERIVRAR